MALFATYFRSDIRKPDKIVMQVATVLDTSRELREGNLSTLSPGNTFQILCAFFLTSFESNRHGLGYPDA